MYPMKNTMTITHVNNPVHLIILTIRFICMSESFSVAIIQCDHVELTGLSQFSSPFAHTLSKELILFQLTDGKQ